MDVVVTVPMRLWSEWIDEGQLPDEPENGWGYHFWVARSSLPKINPGDRVYIVAHGRLRGYAPLVRVETRCRLMPSMACLLRQGGAVAVTIERPIRGFRGWQYRDWERDEERPFPDWKTAGVPGAQPERAALL
jgi:hypothetical protein